MPITVCRMEKGLGQLLLVLDLIDSWYDWLLNRATWQLLIQIMENWGLLDFWPTGALVKARKTWLRRAGLQADWSDFSDSILVQKVNLEVNRLWAPVPLPLETCLVKLVRRKRKPFIALGSNQGSPTANLDAALKMAEQNIRVSFAGIAVSPEL